MKTGFSYSLVTTDSEGRRRTVTNLRVTHQNQLPSRARLIRLVDELDHPIDTLSFRAGVVAESGGVIDGDLLRRSKQEDEEGKRDGETNAGCTRNLLFNAG
jgi:hypothetical protein